MHHIILVTRKDDLGIVSKTFAFNYGQELEAYKFALVMTQRESPGSNYEWSVSSAHTNVWDSSEDALRYEDWKLQSVSR